MAVPLRPVLRFAFLNDSSTLHKHAHSRNPPCAIASLEIRIRIRDATIPCERTLTSATSSLNHRDIIIIWHRTAQPGKRA